MGREELLRRITADPGIMVGKPIIRDTRITVEAILDELAGGATHKQVMEDFPELSPEDVSAALMYAAEAAANARDCGDLAEGVSCDPCVMVGKPVLEGTRITVEQILHDMALGAEIDEFVEDFPYLEPEHFRAAVIFAGRLLATTGVHPVH